MDRGRSIGGGFGFRCVGHDVMDPAGEGMEGGKVSACAVLGDALALDPIFLVGNF